MLKNASNESWEEYRARMIAETERFIEWGLRHPDEVIEIPSKPASQGDFPQQVGNWFWSVALAAKPTGAVLKFRDMLLRRRRNRNRNPWLGK
ncbi:MAG: hypothetical protein ACLFVU_14085 [Phycisphaerae bacterium]